MSKFSRVIKTSVALIGLMALYNNSYADDATNKQITAKQQTKQPEKKTVFDEGDQTSNESTSQNDSSSEAEKKFNVQIIPIDEANIGASMNGRLSNFPFHDGDSFKKGDVLASYVCLSQKAQYEKGMAELYKARGMQVLQTKMKKMGQYSKADILANEAEIRQGQADVDAAQSNLNDCSVIAPYNGVVSNVHVHNYQYTQAGSPLIDIVSNESYEASMIVDSTQMNKFHQGTKIKVHVNELDRDISASFKRVSGSIDPVSRTVKVYAEINDSDLRPGMTGTATIEK